MWSHNCAPQIRVTSSHLSCGILRYWSSICLPCFIHGCWVDRTTNYVVCQWRVWASVVHVDYARIVSNQNILTISDIRCLLCQPWPYDKCNWPNWVTCRNLSQISVIGDTTYMSWNSFESTGPTTIEVSNQLNVCRILLSAATSWIL